MREKELRIALVCYGGISLAVYMHGITKEVWRLARASRAWHAGERDSGGGQATYERLFDAAAEHCGIELRVLVDILAGASAGGINAIFLSEAISTGRSLEPLTDLWLDTADVDKLIDPSGSAVTRWAKNAAVPFAWMLSNRSASTVDDTVEPAQREEVRTKLANFVRARWFSPPFGGASFTALLLDAFDAMAAQPAEPPLLPDYQPLDLFVTVTDFHGHPERLRLHSPAEVVEAEHRLILSFRDGGGINRRLAEAPELAFAARATASFPGAFPPFSVGELDTVLEKRGTEWPGRNDFLTRVLPRQSAINGAEDVVLIDGSVLANAPFGPAIGALQSRPARREIDRRFVYVDPKPGVHSVRLNDGDGSTPGFFSTIFGALSDIPREQPIRDSLEAIRKRSDQITRLRQIVLAMRPRVEQAIEDAFGGTLMLGRPTAARLAAWRQKAQDVAAREAGYAFAGYGHLKMTSIIEECIGHIVRLTGDETRERHERVRSRIWACLEADGLTGGEGMSAAGPRPDVLAFFRTYDLSFRTRRLRYVARRIAELDEQPGAPHAELNQARSVIYDLLGRYLARLQSGDVPALPIDPEQSPRAALHTFGARLDLKSRDDEADELMAGMLAQMPKAERRALILTYLGFAFFDVATLPLLQGEGLDEFHPIQLDRISPDDCSALREGGAEATLKGIQFHSFGAFFSRAYRENDYLWGRLDGAERLIDIVASTLPAGATLPPGTIATLKRDAFRAILAEERPRLGKVQHLIDELEALVA